PAAPSPARTRSPTSRAHRRARPGASRLRGTPTTRQVEGDVPQPPQQAGAGSFGVAVHVRALRRGEGRPAPLSRPLPGKANLFAAGRLGLEKNAPRCQVSRKKPD